MHRVQLDRLTVRGFRNLTVASLEPNPRFNVVSGANGVGKTNLVEAIYFLGTLRSFRTANRRELLGPQMDKARITGLFGDVSAGLEVVVELGREDRTITVDGKKYAVQPEYFHRLPMVLFHPRMMDLLQGGPEERRRFVDRALFQADVHYPAVHRRYQQALAARNAVLRGPHPTPDACRPFDVQLVELGRTIAQARREIVDRMQPWFSEAACAMGQSGDVRITYRPNVDAEEDGMALAASRWSVDCQRKHTTWGPHRDDIGFSIADMDARSYASQGQQRTLVLAAKLAEIRVLTERTGRIPLLLLDDVSSELDKTRNENLFAFLEHTGGQVFITTTHRDYIRIQGDRSDFRIVDGQVVP